MYKSNRTRGRTLTRIPRLLGLLVLTSLILSGVVMAGSGTWPECGGWNCTANDVTVPRFWIGDASGAPLSIQCTPGSPVTAYLWAQVDNGTGTYRYGISFWGHYMIGDTGPYSLDECIIPRPDGIAGGTSEDINLGSITWTCGDVMMVTDARINWGVNSGDGCSGATADCSDYNSKAQCWTLGAPQIVEAPLVANFEATNVCVGEPTLFSNTTTGGVMPYASYAWTFGDGGSSSLESPTHTYAASGTYTVQLTVTDSAIPPNVDSQSYSVDVYPSPVVDLGDDIALTCSDPSATLDAGMAVPSDYTYKWYKGGVLLSGETGATLYVNAAGVYKVEVTSIATGCTGSDTVVVTEDKVAPNVTVVADTTELTCDVTSIGLTASVTGGTSPFTFVWSDGPTGATRNVSAPGTYTVVVTGANGCTDTDSITITQDIREPLVEIEADVTELTCEVGAATLTAMVSGGAEPYTYLWNTGATSEFIVVTEPGTYSVTVTGANGCTDTDSIVITQSVEKPLVDIEATATELTCDVTTVTLTAMVSGGVTPYTYLWSTGSTETSIDVTAPGTYTVTVTGDNGCSSSDSEIITQDIRTPQVSVVPPEAELTCDVTQVTLTAMASGGAEPYDYLWSTGETTQSIVVNSPMTYTVTVTGANGCVASAFALVTQDLREPLVEIEADVTELTCEVGAATLTAMVSGGAEPYTYLWSTGATSDSIVVAEPGTYTVTVTGANGCTGEDSIVITESTDRPNVSIVAPDKVLTCDITEVTLTAQVAAETGEPPFTYLWNTGSTDTSIVVAAAGTYTVTVTGANGCAGSASVVITEDKEPPVVSIATPQPLSATVTEVVLDATASAGTPPYTCLWNTGESTEDITVSATGTYTVTVTGANGCSAQASVDVVYQGLTIVKTGPTEAAELGDILDYSITVTNVGDVTLTNVRVVDAKLGIDQNVGDLAPGASAVVTGSYQVTEADIPADMEPGDTSFTLPNTATATSDQVGPVSDDWDVTVNYEFQAPRAALSITKTGPATAAIGDIIEYEIVVTNVGDVDLTDVNVVDAKLGLDETIALLTVGASQTFSGSYGPVTEADLPGPIHNTAIASQADAETVQDEWDVALVTNPGLNITKVGPEGPVEAGDVVEYTITVSNNGDVTLHNVRVVDAMLGLDETVPSLAPGASVTYNRSYTVTQADIDRGSLYNVATANSDETEEVQVTWTVGVLGADPCIRTDVAVIIYGGWNGIPVNAWVGGTEQEELYTELNAFGEPQVMWTFYPPENTAWDVSVAAQLPAGLDPEEWSYKALTSTTVTIRRCEKHVIYLQLLHEPKQPTPLPTVPTLPETGSVDGSSGTGSGHVLAFLAAGLVLAAGWLVRKRLMA